MVAHQGKNRWSTGIPRLNMSFLVIHALLVFGVDGYIAISSPKLRPFWYIMLAVFAASLLFFCFENYIIKKRFMLNSSPLDPYLAVLILLRNLFVLINLIPLIQLIAIGILFSLWPVLVLLLVLYAVLIVLRFRAPPPLASPAAQPPPESSR